MGGINAQFGLQTFNNYRCGLSTLLIRLVEDNDELGRVLGHNSFVGLDVVQEPGRKSAGGREVGK